MKEFTSIESFRHVIKHVRDYTSKVGKPLPTINFEGTVKLHGCFSKNTLITLADGDRIPIDSLTKGTQILSYDFINSTQVISEIEEVYINDLEKEWIKLSFDDGTEINCTEDHKFYTANRGWVKAIELNNDDEFILDENLN